MKSNEIMLKCFLKIVVILWGVHVSAQQDPMYTQYMFNTLSVNPAYAGSKDAISLMGLFRTQWVGLEGAPVTQTLSFHMPLFDYNMGLGLSLLNDKIGATNQTQMFGDYSYRIYLGDNSKLQLGLKAGISFFRSTLTPLKNRVPGDPSVFDYKGKILFNVGVGVFYFNDKGYLGVSMPKLLKNYVRGQNEIEIGEVRRHLFLIGGYVFDISEGTKFKPSFMLRMVSGAPVSVDLSAMFYFYDKLGLGLAMRREDSFSGLINYYFDRSLFLGYAYDFTRTELRNFSSGTHEIVLGYDFQLLSRRRVYSPRFF